MNPLVILIPTVLWLLSQRKKRSPHKPCLSVITSERPPIPGTHYLDTGSERDFDVFLNFRGPDSRHTVANVLYHSLTRAGFHVFLDNEEIQKGEVIEGELLRAITNSRIYIPIFSKDYASSKWCLRELAKIIECWETSRSTDTKKFILPIFQDVDVSKDVKLRSQVYTTALQKHKDELNEVSVKPWEDALHQVSRIKGWNLKDHGLCELADLINQQVFNKLTTSEARPSVFDHLVGIDKPVEDIMELLEEDSLDVRFIVIHGMGGIGKTTLAQAVFKKISSRFQGRCFLRDVWRADDMVKLQEKLLLDTLNLNFIQVSDIDDGIGTISKRLHDKSVLIVLDDVDKRDHLLKLAAKSYWFGPKSRIIITTRNIDFLPSTNNREYSFYAMKEMNSRHALQLFCRHAFEKDWPPPEYHDMSIEIVDITGGLPLALQVIGSSLCNQEYETWKHRLEKLKEAPHKDVQQTLMISYEALEYEQQQMFLDIACLFNDQKMIDPIYFWEACKFFPNSGIKILVRRSLIKVHDHDTLWMHDQLRDLGRAIAQPKMPALRSHFHVEPSRLWSPEYALDALRKKEVNKNITALKLGKLDVDCHFARDEFARADNLKYLQLQGGNFEGDFKDVFTQLRWLSWFDCPPRFQATNLNCKMLVILKLSGSQIDEDWAGWSMLMEAKHLKVVHLKDCKHLKKTPDFPIFLQLERLVLRDCPELEEINGSINKLERLKYLEISNDFSMYRPDVAPAQPQLLSDSILGLKFLIELRIWNVGLTELHPLIGELVNLKLLYLRNCPHLECLPRSIGKLKALVELNLSLSGIKELPDTIGRLESLEELHLVWTRIILLPETIGNLKRLKVIDASRSALKSLPKSLVKLENLEMLKANFCRNMNINPPENIGKLSRLKILKLHGSRVPTTINQLSHLQDLTLFDINDLQGLSKLPTGLTNLRVIKLVGVWFESLKLHQIPDLSYMTNLVELQLWCGLHIDLPRTSLPSVQNPQLKWLEGLPKLEKLVLVFPDLISPPIELSSLSHLQSLEITCYNPQSLTHIPSSLKVLRLVDVQSPIDWQLLSNLNNLSILELESCKLKEIKVDCLEQLHDLYLSNCYFLERLTNLSALKKLSELRFYECHHLVDIEGLGELKSLKTLTFWECDSIQRLPDLSWLKKLELLRFNICNSLESIPEVDEEAPCYIELHHCKHFHYYRGPYSEWHWGHQNMNASMARAFHSLLRWNLQRQVLSNYIAKDYVELKETTHLSHVLWLFNIILAI